MTRMEFVKILAEKLGITQKLAKAMLDTTGETIVEHFNDEGGVTPFNGFKFSSDYKEAYTGRNPSTGEPVIVNAKYRPKVKFGKYVKDAINN